MCDHGFIGACAICDGCGQQPESDTLTISHGMDDAETRLRVLFNLRDALRARRDGRFGFAVHCARLALVDADGYSDDDYRARRVAQSILTREAARFA